MRVSCIKAGLVRLFGKTGTKRAAPVDTAIASTPIARMRKLISDAKQGPTSRIPVNILLQVVKFDHSLLVSTPCGLYVFGRLVELKREWRYDPMTGKNTQTGAMKEAEIEAFRIKGSRDEVAGLMKNIGESKLSLSTILIHPHFKIVLPKRDWDSTLCRGLYEDNLYPMVLNALRGLNPCQTDLIVDLGGGEGLLAEQIVGEFPNKLLLIEENEHQAARARQRLGDKAVVEKGRAQDIEKIAAGSFGSRKPGVIIMSGLTTIQVLTEEEAANILGRAYECLQVGGKIILTGRMPQIWDPADLDRAGFCLQKSFDLEKFLRDGEFAEIYLIEKRPNDQVDLGKLSSTRMRSQAWAKAFTAG